MESYRVPIMFLFYINDMVEETVTHTTSLFADDAKIMRKGDTKDTALVGEI